MGFFGVSQLISKRRICSWKVSEAVAFLRNWPWNFAPTKTPATLNKQVAGFDRFLIPPKRNARKFLVTNWNLIPRLNLHCFCRIKKRVSPWFSQKLKPYCRLKLLIWNSQISHNKTFTNRLAKADPSRRHRTATNWRYGIQLPFNSSQSNFWVPPLQWSVECTCDLKLWLESF